MSFSQISNFFLMNRNLVKLLIKNNNIIKILFKKIYLISLYKYKCLQLLQSFSF